VNADTNCFLLGIARRRLTEAEFCKIEEGIEIYIQDLVNRYYCFGRGENALTYCLRRKVGAYICEADTYI
jgi:hypothetical protein